MELWSLYESISMLTGTFGKTNPTSSNYGDTLLIAAIVSVCVGLAFFILQGFALYCMAKRRGIGRRYLAFIPFANILLMGRLAGETTFFGQKIKRAGLYAMIAQIIATAITVLYIVAEIHLHYRNCIVYEEVDGVLESFRPYWNEGANGTKFEKFLYDYYDSFSYLLNMIFGLLFEILMLIILMSMFKKYNPEGYIWMTVVVLIVPIARCVILFVFRNRRAVDYQAYMRAKQDAYMRRYQQYYGQGGYNPYGGGSPYGGSNYGGYPSNQGQQNMPSPQREEPFSEFGSNKKPEEPFGEFSSDKKGNGEDDGDGFFN